MWPLDNLWLLILIAVCITFSYYNILKIKRLRKRLNKNNDAINAAFRVYETGMVLVLWIQEHKAYDLSHPEANSLVQYYISSLKEYAHHYPQDKERINEQIIKLMQFAKMPLQ